MGIFTRYLHELQVNGETVGDDDNFTVNDTAEPAGADNTSTPADQADAAAEENTTEDNEDDFTLDETDEEDTDSTTDDEETTDENQDDNDDFTIDDEGGEDAEGGDEGSEDTNAGEETSTDDTSENPTDDIEDEDIKQAEENIYDSLTDNQKRIRVLQLKIDYRDLYETLENTLEGTNRIPKNANNVETINRLVSALTKMKSILIDYINNNFDMNSYLENYTMYIKYMAAFRTISKVIEEINNINTK